MKLSKLSFGALLLSALTLSSCSDDSFTSSHDDYATLRLSLTTSNELSSNAISRTDVETISMDDALGLPANTFKAPDAGDFSIILTDPKGSEIYNGLIKKYDTNTKLKMGNGYKVTATYDKGTVGFYGDNGGDPAYYGEVTFNITSVDPLTVNIPALLTNSILKFTYTSNAESEEDQPSTATDEQEALNLFDKYFSTWEIKVSDSAQNEVTFDKGETRGAFFMATTNKINYSLTPAQAMAPEDEEVEPITGEIDVELVENTCHIFNFNIKNVGGANKLTITIDDETITEVDLGEIDINADPEE